MVEDNNSDKNGNSRIQRKREDIATILIDFESAKNELSQRQYARQIGIPRTTFQHWLSRKGVLDAEPELIDFFESPVGIAFLHRMITAAHFEFCENGPASIHNISNFLKLSKLDSFVGASYSTQRNVGEKMDKVINEFGEFEGKRLAKKMPEKWITLCEDETFHPAICMVAIEALSNFIILEQYVENRDAQTWNKVVGKALEGLPVKVIQVTSDEARGLKSHAEKGLGVHHSSDVFHVSQEIVKGTSGALASAVKKAEKQVETTDRQKQKEMQRKEQYDNQAKRPRGRRPDFEKRIAESHEHKSQAKDNLDAARQNQEIVQQANREIGKKYHPFDPETGVKQDQKKISELLESNFEKIYGAIDGLTDRCKKRVEKAHRVVKGMVGNIAFFFILISQYMDNMELTAHEQQIMNDYLIPGFYLQQVACKEKNRCRKDTISDKSEALLSILSESDGPLSKYSADRINNLVRAAKDCAGFFQRSSSCVEGRNAQLSLRHHGIHRLSSQHLQALTVIHNYYIKRRDGTTAAERFFEAKHNDLFEWVLDRMDYPVRPRKRLSKAA